MFLSCGPVRQKQALAHVILIYVHLNVSAALTNEIHVSEFLPGQFIHLLSATWIWNLSYYIH